MSWFSFQPVNDQDRGQSAFVMFHNDMIGRGSYAESYDTLLQKVAPKHPEIFLEGLGLAINSIDMRDGQVEDAMSALASKSGGRIPDQHSFFDALSNRIGDITFMDWVYESPSIAKDTAIDAVQGVAKIGDSVIATGQTLLMIGPILIVAAVVFIGYSRTRQLAGR